MREEKRVAGNPITWFVSDPHFGHHDIWKWERTQFSSIDEHDTFLTDKFDKWKQRLEKRNGSVLYVLGDWGDTSTLDIIAGMPFKTVFVAGNHDMMEDKPKFEKAFTEVYWYPFYLTNRILLSHYPEAVYQDQINVHGHLHGFVLRDPQHVSCSLNDCNYNPIELRTINSMLGRLPKFNRHFLWEPFAEDMVITNKWKMDHDALVFDPKTKEVDVHASRVLKKLTDLQGR